MWAQEVANVLREVKVKCGPGSSVKMGGVCVVVDEKRLHVKFSGRVAPSTIAKLSEEARKFEDASLDLLVDDGYLTLEVRQVRLR